MTEFRTNVTIETLARFDEVKADLIRRLGYHPSSQETLQFLIHLYKVSQQEGRLTPVVANWSGRRPGGIELR